MKDAFVLRVLREYDHLCGICQHFDEDPEVGRMYGICMIAKAQGKSGRRIVKQAYHNCDEEAKQE